MTKKERNEMADKFMEAANMVFIGREAFSCNALLKRGVSWRYRKIYEHFFKPQYYRDHSTICAKWLIGQFKTDKDTQQWRVQALLFASEMIRQGDFE